MSEARLLAVGDIGPCRAQPDSMFAHVREILRGGDLVFGQLETTLTDRGERSSHAKLAMRSPPVSTRAIAMAGIHVMSAAGNHCMDWGADGLRDTLGHARDAGIHLCGAGENERDARAPVIAQCGDAAVAFLAYSSILPEDYWAEANRLGCAPLRADTHYEMIEPDQPGTPARIRTTLQQRDLSALVADVREAAAQADLVAVSMHWGIHMTPVIIADYQRAAARAAIDAGADIILGHHPHILKGVEFYRGKPIFYSMGNFAIEQPQAFDPEITKSESFRHLLSLHPGAKPEGVYVLPEDTRLSMIVECTVRGREIAEVAILPVWIDDTSTPRVLEPGDPRFARVVDYLRDISGKAGFATAVETRGARAVLTPA